MDSKGVLPQLPAAGLQTVLEVVNGIHEGVSIILDRTIYSIGSQPNADIMLADSDIAAEHGVIRLSGSVVIVEAAGGDISLGKRLVPRGHGCRAALPVELKLGNTALRIARNGAGERRWSGRPALQLVSVGGLACAALVSIWSFDTSAVVSRFAGTAEADVGARAASSGLLASASSSADDTTTGSTRYASPVAPSVVVEALATKLKEVGLLDVVTRVDGTRVVASGAISDDQRAAWSGIQRWFDRAYGDRYILASVVETRSPSPNPRFDLQAVSFGDTPYVITADGQRRYPGAVLDKGWIIKDIRGRRLVLTKDGRDLVLSF